jgi:competence protein ComEC
MKVIVSSTLIFWLCCFIGGIFVFITEHSIHYTVFSGICFFIGSLSLKKLNRFNTYLVYAPLFFIAGFLLMEYVFPKQNDDLEKGENYYVGTIEQQLNVGATWSTNLVKLHAGLTEDKKWKKTSERVLLLTENGETLLNKNDVLLFRTNFKQITLANNPGEFDAKMYWLSKGVRYQGFGAGEQLKLIEHVPLGWFDQLLVDVRNYSTVVLDRWVGKKDAPLIKAILLGDKSDLDTETKRIFTNTGAMHMLAVSGMHIGLIVVLLAGIFKILFFQRGRIIALWLMIILLWFYAFLTGFCASVTRAVAMFTILVFAQLLRREYQPINSLAIAAFFILLWDPMAVFDIGFQLSFLAMVGIFTVYPMLEHTFDFNQKWLNTTWQGTAIGLASQVFTVPIALFYFKQFPNYFILTNFGVMLFSGVMLGLAIGILALGKIAVLSVPIGWILAVCCSLLISFIAYVEMIPGALSVGFTPHWTWVIVVYFYVFIALYWAERKKWISILICLFPLLMWLQADRMSNLYKKEWIIFNSNYPTILFNNGQSQLCFYSTSEKSLKYAKRLVEDYQKIHPGDVDFIQLSRDSKQTIKIQNKRFTIELKKGVIEIYSNTKQYVLITSELTNVDNYDKQTQIISMWNDSEGKNYNLSKGAFRMELD